MDDGNGDAAAGYMTETLPQTFALAPAVATRLLEAGHREPTEMGPTTLARMMEESTLPAIEPKLLTSAVRGRQLRHHGGTCYEDEGRSRPSFNKQSFCLVVSPIG